MRMLVNDIERDHLEMMPGGGASALALKLRRPRPSHCSVGESDFSEKEVKTPTLPNTGRVGHPKNLNQKLGADELK
jgi:hypothetical protein